MLQIWHALLCKSEIDWVVCMQFWPWVNIVPKLNVAPIYEGVGILVIAFRITILIALQTLLNNYKLWWHISAPYAKVTYMYLFYFSTNLVFDMQEQYVTLFMCNINNFGLQGMKQDHWRIKKKPKNDKKNLTPPKKKPTKNPKKQKLTEFSFQGKHCSPFPWQI